ncbi:MAG: hypothetical protein OEU56_06975 [Rhodospirillales bacterium]|nr:hypothetical protein [Rhodospirillales bacterium]
MSFLARRPIEKGGKSLLRLKFYLTALIYCAFTLTASLDVGRTIEFVLFWIGMAFIIVFLRIRCENCGVLAYRMGERKHGLPRLDCLLQPKRCPGCGIERY